MLTPLQQIQERYATLSYQVDALGATLADKPALVGLLLTAANRIDGIFAPIEKPRLRWSNPCDALRVEILVETEVSEAEAQMNAFDEIWLLNQPAEFRRQVCFDITWA